MAKTFAKIAKAFVGLSTTIVARGRRLVRILHFEAKYAKIDCTNEIYAKYWIRRTWTEKVNPDKSTIKVNGQRLVNGQRPTDDVTG